MSKNATLEIVSINQIEISKTNPRKSFDEKALAELSQSIKEHGILQPILVRPLNDKEEEFEQFELVCGERRYRAATMAGIEDIPVNIRVLTDDEAFELQIIENLERKDVHPMDEADAFKKMIDSGKYTIADISAKMAKTESFIAQRLKLSDLIDEVRQDFFNDHLGIGHAILIARCDWTKQIDIHKNAQPYGEGLPDYGTVKDLKEDIEDDTVILDNAIFDLKEDNLVPGVCACDVCPKRSGANPILFSDMQDEDRCFDEKCFDSKKIAFIEKEVAKIISEAKDVVICSGYPKPTDMTLTICKQYDIQILKQYDDYNTHERTDWSIRQAFIVSGSDGGKYIDVYVKSKKEASTISEESSTTGPKTPMSNEEIEAKEEIAKIEARQKRALELDGEKVWAEIRAIDTLEMQKDGDAPIDQDDKLALAVALIWKLSWSKQKEVMKFLDINIGNIYEVIVTDEMLNRLIRIFYLDALNESFGSCETNVKAAAYKISLDGYYASQIDTIELLQKEIAEKRIDKANARITELKAKIEKLKPAEEQKKQAPERTEDVVEIKHFANDVKEFDKVDKKYALNNSYFKNRKNSYPANPLEVAMYHEQHGTLPFDYTGTNWLYDTYIEYQKRNSVYHSQFFTPPATAARIASLADRHFIDPKGEANGRPWVMDMCCGFGMLSKPIRDLGFIVRGFDFSAEMVDLYNFSQDCIAERCDYENDAVELYDWVVANPPYEVPKLTKFFERLHSDILADNGKAIILLPKGFMMKEKPKALVEILEKFNIIHSEDMTEDFAHTKIKAEIVVIEKA